VIHNTLLAKLASVINYIKMEKLARDKQAYWSQHFIFFVTYEWDKLARVAKHLA
jgi:hypothetical protein